MDKIKIIATEDGSFSLYNEALDETYHSRHGAVRESVYVFVQMGLHYLLREKTLQSIKILEVGFGTGLNGLLTASDVMNEAVSVSYESLETFPVLQEVWGQLNYPDPHQLFQKLHNAPWQAWAEITPNFRLKKIQNKIQHEEFEAACYDLIYFDAFAPNKQPEMWEMPVLSKISEVMKPGAVFVTYCAKGQLKRDLKSLGLKVESLPGPPGKREMIRAIKL